MCLTKFVIGYFLLRAIYILYITPVNEFIYKRKSHFIHSPFTSYGLEHNSRRGVILSPRWEERKTRRGKVGGGEREK